MGMGLLILLDMEKVGMDGENLHGFVWLAVQVEGRKEGVPTFFGSVYESSNFRSKERERERVG